MKPFQFLASLLLVATTAIAVPVLAGDTDPLFVNLTSDQEHRTNMAIGFSQAQMERGHPITIFLNDKGVLVASKSNAEKYKEQQAMLTAIMQKGGIVIACPTCMKKYGVAASDLLEGIKVGNPDSTGSALFQDNTKTLSW